MTLSFTEDDLPLQRLYHWEHTRPERIFLTQPHGGGKVRDWTWAQAAGEVRRMAAWLKSRNWEPGTRVGILSKNCAWWVMADLANWMAGYVTVPVYPSLQPHTVRRILEHSQARACFLGATEDPAAVTEGIPPGVGSIRFPTAAPGDHPAWEEIVSAGSPITGNPTRPPDELATIIYTSGTTGTPKGVMHCFGAFSFFSASVAPFLGLTGDERVLSYLPLAHIVERAGLEVPAVLLGWRVFFTEGLDTFVADLQRARPTLFLSVPRLLTKFQQGVFARISRSTLEKELRIPLLNGFIKKRILQKLGLSTVHYAACGAAPLPTDVLMWYRQLGLELVEGYGMTETLITHLPKAGCVRPGCVGGPLPGVEAKTGPENELLIRSPMNMLGYYRDAEGTAEAFTRDGYFRTGDVVQMDPDGQVRIVGRIKEQFKTSKGKYVAPAPIESKLAAHPAVEACCLIGAGLPNPFAVVLLSPEARKGCAEPDTRRRLTESLRSRMEEVNASLDPHERVSFVAVVDGPWTVGNGLMTPTLKVRRVALEGRYQELIEDWKKGDSPVVWESIPG